MKKSQNKLASISVSSQELAKELGVKNIGSKVKVVGVTSVEFPQKNQIIPLLENVGRKNRETIKIALNQGNCFLTTEKIYNEIKSDILDQSTWLLSTDSEIKNVFIKLLTCFDIHHVFHPTVLVKADLKGHIQESSKAELGTIGSYVDEEVFIGSQVVVGSNTFIDFKTTLLGQNYIGHNVKIGKNTLIYPQVTIHNGTHIGSDTIIHSGVVLGSDGFGYESGPEGFQKIPQIGNVVIGNKVEIGSNCSIDRATLNSTRIGNQVKIDNLVQIGHNVTIGMNCVIISQTGIAGSCNIGNQVMIGGQVGIADHVTIEDNVRVASKSGIFAGKHIAAGSVLRGIPAINYIEQARIDTTMRNLIKKKKGNSK